MSLRAVLFALFNFLTHPVIAFKTLRELNAWIREDSKNPNAPVIKDRRLWAKKCRVLVMTSVRSREFTRTLRALRAFYEHPITCLRGFPEGIPSDEVMVLVAVKNDCSRLEHLLTHYRKIGIKYFVFIDNGSDDGTVQAILDQADTACYQTRAEFNSDHKAGWFNRLAAHYGTGRWYVVIDSDELLVYPNINQISIQQYVKKAREKGYTCVKTVMLDVYPDGPLMDSSMSDEEYLERSVYFDRADKQEHQGRYIFNSRMNSVSGGMRARLFFEQSGVKLTKPTLLYFPRIFLLSPHKVFPKAIDLTAPHGGGVLHYKFLPSDRQRYPERARDGNFYGGSMMYKTINSKLEESPVINAMCEYSVKFDADDFVRYLPFIEDLTQLQEAGGALQHECTDL